MRTTLHTQQSHWWGRVRKSRLYLVVDRLLHIMERPTSEEKLRRVYHLGIEHERARWQMRTPWAVRLPISPLPTLPTLPSPHTTTVSTYSPCPPVFTAAPAALRPVSLSPVDDAAARRALVEQADTTPDPAAFFSRVEEVIQQQQQIQPPSFLALPEPRYSYLAQLEDYAENSTLHPAIQLWKDDQPTVKAPAMYAQRIKTGKLSLDL